MYQNLKRSGITYLLTKLKNVFVQIKDSVRSVNNTKPDEYGNIDIDSVPYAQQLESSSIYRSYGAFTQRTTGGSSSIQTGNAWLMAIHGSNEHTGYSAPVVSMTVNSETMNATINKEAFIAAASGSGTITFTFTTAWSISPADYGITIIGTPSNGDTIVVEYTAEVRGTITVSDPQSFTSTGWNLYDHANGIARVVDYPYSYMISGTYLALQYSETLTGTKTDITVTNGAFSVPGDGYVWVTGGNSTDTAIWLAWEDWTEGYEGSFKPYSTSTIDLSGVMSTYFSYGLMKAGGVYDEINLDMGKAINRVERMNYTSANIATARASGREYEYDANYIYLALANPVEYDISIDGAYQADDHGIEFFTGSPIDVYAETHYGQNLRNKVERDVVTISAQGLSTAQKQQINVNIGSIPKRIPVFTGDLNDVYETGICYATDQTTNRPADWSIIETMFYDSNTVKQTATAVITSKKYERTKSNAISTIWSPWRLVEYGTATDLGTLTTLDAFKSAVTSQISTLDTKEEKVIGFGCQFNANGFMQSTTYQGTLRKIAGSYSSCLFEGVGTSSTIPVYVMNNNGTYDIFPVINRSKDFAPSAGDSLLAWLNANVNADTLPFSFVKTGFNACSDVPESLANKEFTVLCIGNGNRYSVIIKTYGGDFIDYQRDVWSGDWNSGWKSFRAVLSDSVIVDTYSYSYSNLSATLTVTAANFGITEKTGYTLMGIIGYSTGSSYVFAYGLSSTTSGNVLYLRNTYSSAIDSGTCRVTCLFIKNDLA